MKRLLLLVASFLASCTACGHDSGSRHTAADTTVTSLRPISEVLAAHTAEWMNLPGVTGTGETRKDGKPAIMIFADSLSADTKAKLPVEVEGYPVVIQSIGKVRAN